MTAKWRISFDLDDTLICYHQGALYEPRLSFLRRLFLHEEPLRFGARGLLRQLRARGWECWIYTTSYRSPLGVRWWLLMHGIRVAGVINQNVHDRYLRRSPHDYPPSKNPRAFGIHLHVDDSEGVWLEGKQYGFRVVVLSPHDEDWTSKVMKAVAEMDGR